MNLLKRGRIYLLRKRGKTVTLLIILTIVTALMLVCGIIWNGTNRAMENLRNTMGGYFKVDANAEKGYFNYVTDDLTAEIMKNEELKAYNGTDIIYALAGDLELEPGRFTAAGDEKAKLARVIGTTASEYDEYFSLGSLKLSEGSALMPGENGRALISESLAGRNQLKAGDTISLAMYEESISGDNGQEEGISADVNSDENMSEEGRPGINNTTEGVTVEIAGIYHIENTQNEKNAATAECDIVDNFIFVNTGCIRQMVYMSRGINVDTYSYGASFYLTDPEKLDGVVEKVRQELNGDEEKYLITVNNKTYEQSAAILQKLNGMMVSMILIFFFVGFVILLLLLVLMMRDRIHEIGVFASMGYRKTDIIGQYLFENVVIAVAAFCIAFASISAAAGEIDRLVNDNVQTTETESETKPRSVVNGIINTEAYDAAPDDAEINISVHIDAAAAFGILGAELLIVILSTGISSIFVIRMKPKNILSMMS